MLTHRITMLALTLACTSLASCGPGPTAADEEKDRADRREAVSRPTSAAASAIARQDTRDLLSIASETSRAQTAITELRTLRWRSLPLEEYSHDLETIEWDGLRTQIDSEYGQFIRSLGEQFSDGDLDEDTYVNAVLMIDSFLSGVMHSRRTIRNHDPEPVFYSSASALCYAPLLRGGIAQELEKFGLEHHGTLSEQQREKLKAASRDMNYEIYDDMP